MVDFKKQVPVAATKKELDPCKLYESLDRASDKGPLRPTQATVLSKWHREHRKLKDVVLKLHTGQGKTLIGLLLLRSKSEENGLPALYLCPNNFLIKQTAEQAKAFGIPHCTTEDEIPQDFLDGKSILITSVQKLFNGKTKFGLDGKSIDVGAIVIDDCHSSIDVIRSSCSILLPETSPAFKELLDLLQPALKLQGAGTLEDIIEKNPDAVLPVPYWEWVDRQDEVLSILSKHKDLIEIKFQWPILKDILSQCQCVISGTRLEIAPPTLPLGRFGSYAKAKHRVYMSATVTDDSYLVRGLQLDSNSVMSPLIDPTEKWSGEKMILFPSLIDSELNRESIIRRFAPSSKSRNVGTVALTPSFSHAQEWEGFGSVVAKTNTIETLVQGLITHKCEDVVVIANRYDGIDLPDDACRLLVLDSRPFSASPIDAYAEHCRPNSKLMLARCIRKIEQGLGRSVRGEKDYCVFLIIGDELTRLLRANATRALLSPQTRAQIALGLEIATLAKQDIAAGADPMKALIGLIRQCLSRDEGWKAFYIDKMNKATTSGSPSKSVGLYELELAAELEFQGGHHANACSTIQKIIDKKLCDVDDNGWYLQEMARYKYAASKTESNKLQVAAHGADRFLMRPKNDMEFEALTVVSAKRMKRIIDWIYPANDHTDLMLRVEDICSRLRFGVKADSFEAALNELGTALGFPSDRPEKSWKEGPDNLWGVKEHAYFLFECKNEVEISRTDINKHEAGQMNTSCAWFDEHYKGDTVTPVLVIPTKKLSTVATLTPNAKVLRLHQLNMLTKKVREFFKEFQKFNLHDLSEELVQKLINTHRLIPDEISKDHFEDPKSAPRR